MLEAARMVAVGAAIAVMSVARSTIHLWKNDAVYALAHDSDRLSTASIQQSATGSTYGSSQDKLWQPHAAFLQRCQGNAWDMSGRL